MALEAVQQGADLVIAAGGDGTINETAEGLVHTAIPLGILPAGTANVLATELGLGSWRQAAGRMSECHAQRIAAGRLTCDSGRVTRHFLLMAGVGLDAGIVYRVNAALKARTGKLAYWVAGWSLLGRQLPEFTVESDGQNARCSFVLASRVRNYGGNFEIARETSLLDDRFEMVSFEGPSTFRYVKYFAALVLGRHQRMRGVSVTRPVRAAFSCPEDRRIYVQIDGEFAGHLPATIEIVPDALTLLVPPEYAAARRIQR
jgi:diacylglycerol kinase family enzyme